ncbi:MAG: ROK family protein [Streptococcaceae bacterium]|jgi:predicted NBD/HSP70 family sugar kinase|nr:ROK family protein [Streptococcaceae bacterium]
MYISFDIGGTTIKHGIVAENGEILEKSAIPTAIYTSDFLSDLTEVIKDYRNRYSDIQGIGLSAPGCVSPDGVMTTFGRLLEMYGLPLRAELTKLTGLPVVVENDANCVAIAEKWLGAAQKTENYLVMTLGTGLGGGVVINGKIFKGAHGMAGEFGSMLTDGLTRVGELEDISQQYHSAAINGLLRRYNLALESVSHGKALPVTEAKKVVELAEKGEDIAMVVFDEFLSSVSVALLNLTALFDPELILIGGGISANSFFMQSLSDRFDSLVSRHFGLRSMRENNILGKISQCQLKNDAGLIGAAYNLKQVLKMS